MCCVSLAEVSLASQLEVFHGPWAAGETLYYEKEVGQGSLHTAPKSGCAHCHLSAYSEFQHQCHHNIAVKIGDKPGCEHTL
jgi:hypothetical protein